MSDDFQSGNRTAAADHGDGQFGYPVTPRMTAASHASPSKTDDQFFHPGQGRDASWPDAFGRDSDQRQAAPTGGDEYSVDQSLGFVEPDDASRPATVEHGHSDWQTAVDQDGGASFKDISDEIEGESWAWSGEAEDEVPDSPDAAGRDDEDEEPEKVAKIETPPTHADLVTVEEAVAIFREKGLPRHMRTIQKYCAKKTGRALVCYQVPTENGIRFMIERSSIDRFIGDAAQQAPTGAVEGEQVTADVLVEPARREQVSVDAGDIFEHPYVMRLEGQIEKLEDRNEELQSRIQSVLEQANERLVELQKANAVAQSESLGKFLLEGERIRNEFERQSPVPVDREVRDAAADSV